jgi:prevent-host-death family protein
MTTVVNMHEAKTHLSRLIERAVAGEQIIIAKAGEPRVCLTPVGAAGARQPGLIVVPAVFFEPLSEVDLTAWEGR